MNRQRKQNIKARSITLPLCAAVLFPALFAAPPMFAATVAHLRNGFSIAHRSHELRGSLVRLYMNDAKTSYVDLPANQIASYSVEPEPVQAIALQPASTPSRKSAEASIDTAQLVREAGEQNGVDADFLASVIHQESGGNARAVSPAGARGLMQLMPATAARMGVEDSFNPEQNVHGGARYLRELLERYRGDAIRALAAYNAGPEAVDRYQGVPPYPETRRYVQRVVRDYNHKKTRAASARTGGKRKGSQPRAAIPNNR